MSLAPEVAGAIVGGAIGIVSATVTAGVNYHTTKRRLRSKNRRRLAEFYLDKKVEALSEVHTSLTECYATLGTALENPSGYSWERVRSEIHSKIDGLEHSITVSDIYLSSEQETELRETVEEYRSVADKIAILENGRRDMIDDVFGATERAGGTLAEEINGPIRRLERAGGDADDRSDERTKSAESRKVPAGRDDSGWAVLAAQRDRIRNVFRIDEDGRVEFLAEGVEPEARAFFTILGRRYAYERDLVESPTVAETDLLEVFDGSREAFEAFVSDADEHLMSDDDEHYVEAEDIEAGIDWAATHVEGDVVGRSDA
ncbi:MULTISPECIES: hypothetical protein [Halorussus]|uniref:hypothetical protein n=1 Tax=Halorussus TaxID=1070314 RepID=UPI00209ECED1|nr:hypothetical protein [Halorussus vallis]USZ74473.1 hypothetical protein NGM07_13585 [Halorussus vallis]